MKKIIVYVFALSLTIVLFACNNSGNQENSSADSLKNISKDTVVQTDTAKKVENTQNVENNTNTQNTTTASKNPKYICADHCKNGNSDKPGDCKDCGMELIENPDYKK